MEGKASRAHPRALGAQLAKYVRNRPGSSGHAISAMQSVIADLTADQPDLGPPLRDLVARAQFQTLIQLAGSGTGEIQRNALINDLSRIYNPDTLSTIQEFLNGFLECSGGSASPAPRAPSPVVPAQDLPASAATAAMNPPVEPPQPIGQPPLVDKPSGEAGSRLSDLESNNRTPTYSTGRIEPNSMNYDISFFASSAKVLFISSLVLSMVFGAFSMGVVSGIFALCGVFCLCLLYLFLG